MKKLGQFIFIVGIVLFSASIASADAYFRANAGGSLSSDQDISLSLYGEREDFDLDEDGGLNINGALGYKPGPRNQSNFFGEIESGYSRADADFSVMLYERHEGPEPEFQVESRMEFVHLFFNVGYEYVTSFTVVDSDPLKVSVFAGAGPVFSEIYADVTGPRGGQIQLDNIEGDTALGYQFGGNIWLPILPRVEVGGGVKYVDRGEHRTIPGIKYGNDSVDATAGVRIWF